MGLECRGGRCHFRGYPGLAFYQPKESNEIVMQLCRFLFSPFSRLNRYSSALLLRSVLSLNFILYLCVELYKVYRTTNKRISNSQTS